MSQSRKLDEDSDMAISYASGLPASNSQTLPSFRELLPPHLHDEIESTSYYTSPRHQAQDRPVSGHEMTADPRSIPGYGANAPPSKFVDTHREYPATRTGETVSGHNHLPVRMGGSASPTRASHYASRGPSPILPPLRGLQSMPERGVNAPSKGFSESRAPPRSDPFGPQDYRAGHPPPSMSGPMADPRNADPYLANSGTPMMHAQAPYGHPPMGYQADPEQLSPQMMVHPQQANFGIMGDSIDPKTKRRRGNLPKPVTDILRAWFHEHLDHPYPSEEDKQMFMTRTGLSISQISNWFINARRRQLPALRNQMRSGGADADSQRQSPFSDLDQASESLPSPRP